LGSGAHAAVWRLCIRGLAIEVERADAPETLERKLEPLLSQLLHVIALEKFGD
jgi:hypothetical protein